MHVGGRTNGACGDGKTKPGGGDRGDGFEGCIAAQRNFNEFHASVAQHTRQGQRVFGMVQGDHRNDGGFTQLLKHDRLVIRTATLPCPGR